MKNRIYNISYSGLDKEYRIDCLAQIRRTQNPPGSTCLDVDGLCRSNRSTKEDALSSSEPREKGKLVRIGKIEF